MAGRGARTGGGYDIDPHHDGDGFIEIDHDIQKAILLEGEQAEASGDQPRQVIRHPWDTPVSTDPLIGELGPALGHGTFIAGIVRQVAPRARVLSIRVMHSDDIVYEGDLLTALTALASRVALAEATDPAKMVDVVSLSLGYFSESPADQAFSSALWQAIQVLLDLGVVVVAAAGNFSTTRLFYPAAFAQRPTPAGHVPLISVGALNPNGSRAVFSDGGHWVTAWASGGAVVSTLPTDVNGSRSPELRLPAHPAGPLPAWPRAGQPTARPSTRTTTPGAGRSGAAPRSRLRCWPRTSSGPCWPDRPTRPPAWCSSPATRRPRRSARWPP